MAAIVRLVRSKLEGRFRDIWVEGEVADLTRARSGHVYFSLHDESGEAVLNSR